ncbi:MAG TPA: DUF2621 family protein [Terriglobales bacterium]|nr:DUF2621 family protein [Terriglobales bacterium]
MTWSDEAKAMIEALLHELPAPVRAAVQESAEGNAESLTGDDGEDEVSMETAVRAFIEATPSDLRRRLRGVLTYHGIDPEDYEEAFNAE